MNGRGVVQLLATGVLLTANVASAQEPDWWGVVIADPTTQVQIERTDILQRPYRPFHIYGNTVRRMHYRGNPFPTLTDFSNSLQALVQGPTPWPVSAVNTSDVQ